MDTNKHLRNKDNDFRIRNLLTENDINLLLPPYFQPDQQNENLTITDPIRNLASKFHETLNIDIATCAELLLNLQKEAINQKQKTEELESEGLANIRVKVSGYSDSEFSVQLSLTNIGDTLRQKVALQCDISWHRLKLIFSGKMLSFSKTLEEQNIRNNSFVLILVLPECVENNEKSALMEVMKNLQLVLGKPHYRELFWFNDQYGNSVYVPPHVRESFVMFIMLHEKGRVAFKKEQYSLAMLFFLKAENVFEKRNEWFLSNWIDNYGILNLDIVWCFLHLESFYHLVNSAHRLEICDSMLTRCYGSRLERLRNIRGCATGELILLIRLRLLQAIIAHLLNQPNAKLFLNDVGKVFEKVKINQDQYRALITLGCTQKEAIMGLRTCGNNQNLAHEYIMKHRALKIKTERINDVRRMTRHTKCLNEDPIDSELLLLLIDMGIAPLIAVIGLKNCNNELNKTLKWIQDFNNKIINLYPEEKRNYLLHVNMKSKKFVTILKTHQYELTEKCIEELIVIGCSNENDGEESDAFSEPSTSSNSSGKTHSVKYEDDYDSDFSEDETLIIEKLADGIEDPIQEYLSSTLENEMNYYNFYRSLIG